MKKKSIIIITISIIILIILLSLFIFKNNDNQIVTSKSDTDNIHYKTQAIEGTFSDTIVNDFSSAKEALNSIKDELNISLDDLKEDGKYLSSDYINIYNFYQEYKGIKVYDSYLNVYTDKKGNVHGTINNLKEINIDINSQDTDKENKQILEDKLKKDGINEYEILKDEKLIYPYNNSFTLVTRYEITYSTNNLIIIIKDDNKKIIEEYISKTNLSAADATEYKQSDGWYEIFDEKRNIMGKYFVNDKSYPERFRWTDLNKANEYGVDNVIGYFKNAQKIYDFYLNKRLNGMDNTESQIDIVSGATNVKGDNARKNAFFNAPRQVVIGADISNSIEVVAHEYTHGIFYYLIKDVGNISNTNIQAPSINEAYADIMGMIIEDFYGDKNGIDGIIDEVNRDIKSSTVTYYDFVRDGYEKNQKKEEHYYSQIISRVAYNTSNFLSLEDFINLWYDSMFLLKGTNVSFYDCKYVVLRLAEARFSDDIVDKINNEFNKVGLTDKINDSISVIAKKYYDKEWEKLEKQDNENLLNADEEKNNKENEIIDNNTNTNTNANANKSDNTNNKTNNIEQNNNSVENNKNIADDVKDNIDNSISLDQARQILVKNEGTNWKGISISCEYISQINVDGKNYYMFIEYSDEDFSTYGGEWLAKVDNGKYYVKTLFIGTEKNGNYIAYNFAKNYEETLKAKKTYNGYIYTDWREIN